MPRAGDFPDFNVSYNEIPSTSNALGVKGAGEAGTVGAPAAFINAMIDALRPYGIEEIDMPVTPLKLWNILQGGRKVALILRLLAETVVRPYAHRDQGTGKIPAKSVLLC